MFDILKKIFGKKPTPEEYMVYSLHVENPAGRVRVYIQKGKPGKYRFEYKTNEGSTSFYTRRHLTEYMPVEELQSGIYDEIVNDKFKLNITFQPQHYNGSTCDRKQSNL